MELEITLLSAKGLRDVGAFSKMDVYVAVTVSGDPRTEQKTPVDEDGGSSPHWNHTMKFVVDEGAIQMNALNLIFQLRHERVLVGDKPVGEVQVPIKDLLSNGGQNKVPILVEYPVREISGKNKGKLKFSYKFGTSKARGNEMYPPPPQMYPPVVNGSYPPTAPPLGYPPQGTSTMAPPPSLGYPPQGHVITGPPVPPMGYPSQGPAHGPPPPMGYPPQDPPHGPPPPMGYPPQGPPHGAHMPPGYPPSPQLPGYGPPSYGGYPPTPLPTGYQSGGSGYGYQPAQQAKPQKDKKDKKKKKNDKEGVGSGIVAGLMGGLLAGALLDGI